MTSHRFVKAIVALMLVAGGSQASAQTPNLKAVMRNKLVNTQALLTAVVTADYAGIDRAAMRLSRISESELGSWQTPGQPEYTQQAMVFMESVQGLREAARQRNYLAAGSRYTALVSSCVACHAFVRRSQVISLKPARLGTK